MLNLDHPMAEHILAAARLEDRVLVTAHKMTAASRELRLMMLEACQSAFQEMRELSRDHFTEFPEIPAAIDELEEALDTLATLPGVPQSGGFAQHKCPACGAELERRGRYGFPAPDHPTDIYCSPCLDIVRPSLSHIRSWERGFGTDAI
jgi:hypothetical protein